MQKIFLVLLVVLVSLLAWVLVHMDLPKLVFVSADVDQVAAIIAASDIEYDPSIIPSQDQMERQSMMYIERVGEVEE